MIDEMLLYYIRLNTHSIRKHLSDETSIFHPASGTTRLAMSNLISTILLNITATSSPKMLASFVTLAFPSCFLAASQY